MLLADMFIGQGQLEKARVVLEGLDDIEPDRREVIKALSLAYLRAGRHEDALAATERFLRLSAVDPSTSPILLIRGRALIGMGRDDEARESFARYLELSEDR